MQMSINYHVQRDYPVRLIICLSFSFENSTHGFVGKSYFRQFASRLEFTKSSVLGITVFGLYEYLILRRVNKEKDRAEKQDAFVCIYRHIDEHQQGATTTNTTTGAIPAQVSVHPETSAKHTLLPLSYHLGAGALAGAAQSVVLDGWEILSYWTHRQRYRHLHDGHAPDLISLVNTPLILRRLVHHSLGYMTLFGTYECLRREGQDQVRNVLQSGEPWVAEHLDWLLKKEVIGTGLSRDNQEMYDLTSVPLLVSFGAGGFAGQSHYIVSHYLRQLRKTTNHSHHIVRHPTLSTTCIAFLPTAISFMAFQYGGELTERILGLQED